MLMSGPPQKTATWSRLSKASGTPQDTSHLRIPELRSRLDWPDAFPDDQLASKDGLVVTTIHQSRGLEFDIVTLVDPLHYDAGSDFAINGPNDPSILEEANLPYVALTRAGKELNRLNGNNLYEVPRPWKLSFDRRRLCLWRRVSRSFPDLGSNIDTCSWAAGRKLQSSEMKQCAEV